ncbi:MAG: hypothetical protein ACI9HK_003075 [Pirellulaceae bacterium]|jgi:hypothetical protein
MTPNKTATPRVLVPALFSALFFSVLVFSVLFFSVLVFSVLVFSASATLAADIPLDASGFKSHVVPFFKTHCINCHGPTETKGDITLHALDGDLSAGHEIERWGLILEMLESGEMPPEEMPQPSDAERQAVVKWIDAGLREYVNAASQVATVPTMRRLTNFEYQNTIRDLLGFELELIKNLPEDPVKPYKFNNTAQFMLMGMEQLDRYKENARRAMASAIVDPSEPTIHKTRREWEPRPGLPATQIQFDELGGRRGSPGGGIGLTSWPETGEFRIRIKSAAILPNGIKEVPLYVLMGNNINENSSTLQTAVVGMVPVGNNLDNLKVFEFRGRIENYPARAQTTNGKVSYSMTITPQNIYDDGRLNDRVDRLKRPRLVVKSIEFEAPVFDAWPPKHHTDILFESPLRESDPKAYVREVLRRFMTRAFRRPVENEEVETFANIYKIVSMDLPTMEEAIRETLAMVLISPDFMYHTVAKEGVANRQYEMACKLSYFLWGSMPDQELIGLAKDGKLADAAVIDQQVRRLLKDKRSHDFVDNFTSQWLSIAKMKQVKINAELFPRFLFYVGAGERTGTEVPYRPTIRDDMLAESVGFVAELIRRNASVLNVVDSDFAILNQRLAVHYGVDGVQGHALRPVAIKPEHNLGGLLTHGSVLIGNSTGSAPHPIYRAVWLREAILGDEVKPPPADVPALSDSAGESAEQALSIKNLLAKHRQKESCSECHVRLDPWGIPFERYNAIGQFQPMVPKENVRISGFSETLHKNMAGYLDYLKDVNTERVEADARVPHGPKVDGMQDLKKHLLEERQDDVAKNMIRRLLSYGIGRDLTYRDRYSVEELLQQSKKNEYKLQDMIVAICRSKIFVGK